MGDAGLADTGLASKHDYPPVAGQGIGKGESELRHLTLAANEYMANVASGLGFYHATTIGS